VDEMLGQPAASLYADPEERDRLITLLKENRKINDYLGHGLRKDGTSFQVSMNVQFVINDNGEVIGTEGVVRDITERLHAEERAKLLTERLALATSAAKLGIWDWDILNNELIWDDGMYRLYNTNRDDFAGAYEAWSRNIHPEDKVQTEQAIQDALDGKAEYAPEFRIIWSDGSVHFLQASAFTFRDSSGKPTRMVGINYDVTMLRMAEADLRENEMRFRSFVEQSPIAIGIFSLDGLGLYANQKFIETLGLTNMDEFVGRPAYNYFAPQFIEESKERTRRRLRGLPVPLEYESIAVHPDGSEFPVHLAIAPINLPSGIVSIAFLSDITNRKEAETAVKLETERYHALIESTKDWIWVVDSENFKLTLFNSSVASYFKRNHGVILKPGMIREETLSEKQRDLWKGFYNKAIREGAFTTEYQTDAGKLNFIVSLAPLIIDKKTVGVSVFAKDITTETHYKEELELSNQALSKRLQQSLNAISKIGEIRDAYTAGHQRKVMELSCAIARELGLSDESIVNISFGALIHDIGKIYIASDILNRPGKLTNLEYQILQTHVDQSYEIVKEIDFPDAVIEMIHQHHERMDGSGYPQKLVGAQIIIEGRVLAVADVVEAMVSHRPYRPALGIDKALEEILQFRGEKYDVDVVDACVRLFREKGFEFTHID
jgi:PAS domain S-box-containing protein/putative nucleotidyltransferase with HDIG domain